LAKTDFDPCGEQPNMDVRLSPIFFSQPVADLGFMQCDKCPVLFSRCAYATSHDQFDFS
jgi:hypothetical protein